ncbi:hypothetical protein ACWGAN_07685 [Streptomyces sp. NPDC054945]
MTVYLFREEDRLVITLEFWREEHLSGHPEDVGAVFVVEIPVEEFVGILEGVVAALDVLARPGASACTVCDAAQALLRTLAMGRTDGVPGAGGWPRYGGRRG